MRKDVSNVKGCSAKQSKVFQRVKSVKEFRTIVEKKDDEILRLNDEIKRLKQQIEVCSCSEIRKRTCKCLLCTNNCRSVVIILSPRALYYHTINYGLHSKHITIGLSSRAL